MLAWRTERLLALEASRDQHTVYVRPELVVEIAFNDIQESRRYPGRLALRFARVRRYRTDKTPPRRTRSRRSAQSSVRRQGSSRRPGKISGDEH